MAEESGKILEERVEGRLDGIENRLSRLDGTVEQMDRRLSNVEQLLRQILAGQEQGSRWLIGLVVGAWLTIMLTILFKG